MPGLLAQSGGQPQKQPRYAPIFIDRTFTGLYTQRAVLHDPADVVTSKFYGGRPDALLDGRNVELTNRLTLQRRPGLTPFSCATYPTAPLTYFSFQLTDGTIRVIVDTGSSSFTFDKVQEVSGVAYYLFSTAQPLAANNAFVGYSVQVAGFDQANNNGTFTVVSSTSMYLILDNAAAVTDTEVGTGTTAGAVYWDQQSNCQKTLLWNKAPGAGQTYFVAVAGTLYAGDGVDLKIYTPFGPNGTVFNWGGTSPANPPVLSVVESGSAAVTWQPSTFYSTMGLLKDANGNVEFLTGVNASGTNTTQYGLSGDGQPDWSNITGQITVDNTCNWTCWGPISLWTPNTTYTFEQPIYDPGTNWIFQSSGGKSGPSAPQWSPVGNTHTNDANGMIWQAEGPALAWVPNFTYHAWYEHVPCVICEPIAPTQAILQAGTQEIYLQSNNDQVVGHNDDPGVSGSGYTPPWPALGVIAQTTDGDLQWVSLGSATWAADTSYFAWSSGATDFSVVEDPYGDFQVCITGGVSGSIPPYSQWQAGYVYAANSTIAVKSGASFILFHTTGGGTSGSTQPQWNFNATPTTDNTVTWTYTGTVATNVWGQLYGATTSDGTVTWTNVGPISTWATSTQWYYPTGGFYPQAYGGAEVIGGGEVQIAIASGLSGSTQPLWPSQLNFVLTAVGNASGQNATYTGTITGGGSNAFAGCDFAIAGFAGANNNGTFNCTASSTMTLTLTNPAATVETHAATAVGTLGSQVTDNTVVWYTDSVFSQNSLSYNTGLTYAYSFESRLPTDYYNTNMPPGVTWEPNGMGPPTGSETGAITTATPAATVSGSNPGAVITVTGVGPTDPAYDTVIIWRSADGGGSSNMFFLTEFAAPTSAPWSFQDYLPSTATSVFPGLNTEEPAPIAGTNNPPPAGFLPMVFNYNRIWGVVGSTVYFSGGPDIVTGTSTFSFNIADNFPFLAPVIRLVKTSQGLITFLSDSIELIGGGPLTTSFFSVTLAPGIGLGNYNGLDVYAGEVYFFSADGQVKTLSPALSLASTGFPIGDKLALFDPHKVYLAVQEAGVDNCIFVTDGSTGWYRNNPRQIPGLSSPESIWSPFALITGGAQAVVSIEVSPGIKKLLVGSPFGGNIILERNLNVFTDNNVEFDAYFVMGSIVLCHPGEISLLKFIECDFSGVSYKPQVSYLLNEISGAFTPFVLNSGNPVFDPPSLYGTTITPQSYSPNRYYFAANGSLARCRHLQIKVDLGTTSNGDEIYNLTIYGRLVVEL